MDHNYMGHTYIGHNYIGHKYIGHNYIGHNYIGHDYVCHNYMGHNYIAHIDIGQDRLVEQLEDERLVPENRPEVQRNLWTRLEGYGHYRPGRKNAGTLDRTGRIRAL